ncbi:uncharacterized protein C8Q71DRAFT_504950 [Rhodofomes roseus]|uniref:Uncharacterized protein n=1 Tax=Rhodofomes roseus TaxID=34475 RepID=A0ABQ8KLT5_9APHY|nr:uncharacterized protein C8Q71DRAFT_504950 [Rhodofomes roseus]KAH9839282.1 hypothetical protein C8Q71DRAFT_504950 [Rhodofomes roseus]
MHSECFLLQVPSIAVADHCAHRSRTQQWALDGVLVDHQSADARSVSCRFKLKSHCGWSHPTVRSLHQQPRHLRDMRRTYYARRRSFGIHRDQVRLICHGRRYQRNWAQLALNVQRSTAWHPSSNKVTSHAVGGSDSSLVTSYYRLMMVLGELHASVFLRDHLRRSAHLQYYITVQSRRASGIVGASQRHDRTRLRAQMMGRCAAMCAKIRIKMGSHRRNAVS